VTAVSTNSGQLSTVTVSNGLSGGAIAGIVGGILGVGLFFLIGVVLFLLRPRNSLPDLTTSGDDTNAERLGKDKRVGTVGGRLRYNDILNEDGILQSGDS
jgi:hypothetical protein